MPWVLIETQIKFSIKSKKIAGTIGCGLRSGHRKFVVFLFSCFNHEQSSNWLVWDLLKGQSTNKIGNTTLGPFSALEIKRRQIHLIWSKWQKIYSLQRAVASECLKEAFSVSLLHFNSLMLLKTKTFHRSKKFQWNCWLKKNFFQNLNRFDHDSMKTVSSVQVSLFHLSLSLFLTPLSLTHSLFFLSLTLCRLSFPPTRRNARHTKGASSQGKWAPAKHFPRLQSNKY